jgi:predicted alpha/beta-hydrolase family hydrolase
VAERIKTAAGKVSVALDGPERFDPLLLLAHGAGGDMNSAFMARIAAGLAERDVDVLRFNFAYSEKGKKTPDRTPVLEQTVRDVTASQVVAQGLDADGIVFLGYPLHPPGRPERLRADHLSQITAPMLFVEGTRDPFCPLATLEAVREGLKAKTKVAVIEDGDHSFKVRMSSGRSTEAAWNEVIDSVVEWLR